MKRVVYDYLDQEDDNGVIRKVRVKKLVSFNEPWRDHGDNLCMFREDGSISCQTINNEPSLTIQSEKDKCDLEVIRRIYEKSGIMHNIRTDQPRYGDFTSSRELHDVLLRAQEAQEDFMLLDAQIRRKFDNDPGKLLDYVADPKNREEAIQLGLIKAPATSPQASQVPQGDKATPPEGGV